MKLLFDFADDGDFKLKANEFIKIVAIKPDGLDKNGEYRHGYSKVLYVQDLNEFISTISRYRFVCNLFVGLSTYLDRNGTKESVRARKVMFFDFDKKDYPQYTEVSDFTKHIKNKIPYLFNHCLVDSGHGYHFYVAVQKTVDMARATRINKNLAKILGADLKAASPTQIVRLPTTLNLKNESKPVNIISNNYGSARFKPYTLNKLEKFIAYAKLVREIKSVEPLEPQQFDKKSNNFCIEKMLAGGCAEGERNFCLGRITKYLQQIKGYRYDNAFIKVQEWNRRCLPPKSAEEIRTDFDNYWKSDYKLLGCKLSNQSDQSILNKYCEKYQCSTICKESNNTLNIKAKEVLMDNHLLKNDVLKKMRGNHYLILSVLHIKKDGLTLAEIKEEITCAKTNECCISRPTLKKVIDYLLKNRFISCNMNGIYKLNDIPNFGLGFTRYYYSAAILLINGIIKQQDYKVYLALVRNLQQNKSVTYSSLSDDTGIAPSNISEHMRRLFNSKILLIEKSYNDKGVLYNSYTLVA